MWNCGMGCWLLPVRRRTCWSRYNKLTNEILALPKVRAELSKQGLVIVGGSAKQFEDFIADEVRRWEKVIVDAGLTPDKT